MSQTERLTTNDRKDGFAARLSILRDGGCEEMSLIRQRNSLTVTVMKEAWEDQDVDPENPGKVVQYYDKSSGQVIIDFNGCDDV